MDWRELAQRKIIVAFAGRSAEHRATRGSEPGWRRAISAEYRTAVHEGGHIVASAACGLVPYRASIVENKAVKLQKTGWSLGFAQSGLDPIAPPDEPRTSGMTDVNLAAALCRLEDPKRDWKSILADLRPLKKMADRVVDANWLFVMGIADYLVKHKTIDQQEIARILRLDQAGEKVA